MISRDFCEADTRRDFLALPQRQNLFTVQHHDRIPVPPFSGGHDTEQSDGDSGRHADRCFLLNPPEQIQS